MPISSFGDTLQKIVMFLPGTYGTSLVRNHSMRGVLLEMEKSGIPAEVISGIKNMLDCNLYFFENKVSSAAMYAVLGGAVALLIIAYVLMNFFKTKE